MEYMAASVFAVMLGILAVAKPTLYAERVFKPVYYLVMISLVIALATVYVCNGVVSNHLVYALAAFGAVCVALLPLSGKLSGRW
jgi:hypothetical protein